MRGVHVPVFAFFCREHFEPILDFHVMFRPPPRMYGLFFITFFRRRSPDWFRHWFVRCFLLAHRPFVVGIFDFGLLFAPSVSIHRRSSRTRYLRRRGHQFPQPRQCVDQFTAATSSSRLSSLVVRFGSPHRLLQGAGFSRPGFNENPLSMTCRALAEKHLSAPRRRFYGRNQSSAVDFQLWCCDEARKTSASMGVCGWRNRYENMGNSDAAGAIFCIPSSGTWKARTRSGPWIVGGTDGLIFVVDGSNRTGQHARRGVVLVYCRWAGIVWCVTFFHFQCWNWIRTRKQLDRWPLSEGTGESTASHLSAACSHLFGCYGGKRRINQLQGEQGTIALHLHKHCGCPYCFVFFPS